MSCGGVWRREAWRGLVRLRRGGCSNEDVLRLSGAGWAVGLPGRRDGGMCAQGVGHRLRSGIVGDAFGEEPHLRERVQGSAALPRCFVMRFQCAGSVSSCWVRLVVVLMAWWARVGGFTDAASQGGVWQEH